MSRSNACTYFLREDTCERAQKSSTYGLIYAESGYVRAQVLGNQDRICQATSLKSAYDVLKRRLYHGGLLYDLKWCCEQE